MDYIITSSGVPLEVSDFTSWAGCTHVTKAWYLKEKTKQAIETLTANLQTTDTVYTLSRRTGNSLHVRFLIVKGTAILDMTYNIGWALGKQMTPDSAAKGIRVRSIQDTVEEMEHACGLASNTLRAYSL